MAKKNEGVWPTRKDIKDAYKETKKVIKEEIKKPRRS